jgi:hypothetical protein
MFNRVMNDLLIPNSPPNRWLMKHRKGLLAFSVITGVVSQIPWAREAYIMRNSVTTETFNPNQS